MSSVHSSVDQDDKELLALGYVPSFKREFSNLATISFAFSIMGLCSSIATTFNTPLLLGGPASVTWCWILGATMCFTLGSSIAEIVSAFPTCGGLYTASAQLTPRKYRAIVGWIVGWLNILGQIAGVSSTEFGLSGMILGAVVVGRDGNFEVTQPKVVGLFIGLLAIHGLLNSVGTRHLARFTQYFVFINLGATALIIIVLLATTPRSEMHPASYVFGKAGLVNQTGGWNDGLSFLFGLLSVQWTANDRLRRNRPHFVCPFSQKKKAFNLMLVSEEVKRAAYAAPAAIFIAVIGTGLIGWLLNIVLVLCSGPLENFPGASGSAMLDIMTLRMGKTGALVLWAFVCLTAFFVVQTALQAASRTVFAFSRDHGLPDRGYFGYNSKITHTPLRSIWLCTFLSVLPGLLALASSIATFAIFSLTAIALDLSYVIPIALRRIFQDHPEVMFKPGPFYLGPGLLGWACNLICIFWTAFICVIFSFPTVKPVTPENMNYASVITVGVMFLSFVWYIAGARRHYKGPTSNITDAHLVDAAAEKDNSKTDSKEEMA
ncbi:APC amino acid permease [Mycena kentingensis (nom. inval.)]|nr:APC amino acid permease [Mycena kentingensis (nom. inval.)]